MKNWYSEFYPYWKEETLAQYDGDTGDSSQRVGTFWVLMHYIGFFSDPMYSRSIKSHEIVPGRYRRSPIQSFWGSDPTNFSRDQHSILNLCFAVVGDKKRLLESYKDFIFRFGFHQNMLRGTDDPEKRWKIPDIMTPNQFSVFIRGMDLIVFYPILLILDLFFFLDLIFRKTHLWDADNMGVQNVMYAATKYPTPWSIIVFHLYAKTDFKERLKHYHTSGNGIKPLYDLYLLAYDTVRRKNEKNIFDRIVISTFRVRHEDISKELR